MRDFLRKHHRSLFYSLWFLLGIFQATFTELQDDEAYYWVFSRFLDWGYFDHPPMTALLIKIGYALIPSALGVRLLMVVLNTLTVFLCEKLTERKYPKIFYAICLSLAVLQLAGFWAVPDIPLMFFTALFFWSYKRFVQQSSLKNTLLLSLITCALLYSKYHAVLIIFFTLLSNLRLFGKWQTYAAGLLALALFTPHLWWQYQHDWISFRYHLFESNVNPYKISHTTDYLLGQLLIAGPLAGIIFWNATIRYKTRSHTERALQFTGLGIVLFFFLSSFRGKVEANWTAPAIIPVIVLSHQYLIDHGSARRWTYRLLPVTLVLMLVIRAAMIIDFIPAEVVKEHFHRWKGWPQEMKKRTHGLPIVLSSSYQNASKYWFYSGQTTYSLNEYNKRRNNYNFWPIEDSLLGKPVYVFNSDLPSAPGDTLATPTGTIRYALDSSFHSFSKVMIVPEKREYRITENRNLPLGATIQMPEAYALYLKQNPGTDFPVKLGLFDQQQWLKDIELHTTLQQLYRQQHFAFEVAPAVPKGTYFLRFAIGSDPGWFTHNSDKIKLIVE